MRIEIQNRDGATIVGPRWNHLREHIFENLLHPRLIVTATIICKSHQLFAISLLAPLIGNVFLLFLFPVSGIVPRFLCHCSFFLLLSLSLSLSLSFDRSLFAEMLSTLLVIHSYNLFVYFVLPL